MKGLLINEWRHIILCMILLTTCNFSEAKRPELPLDVRFQAAYLDTVVIKSPVLVNIDGIGYLNSKDNLDFSDPSSIINNVETCVFLGVFYYDRTVRHWDFRKMMSRYSYILNNNTRKYLMDIPIEFPYDNPGAKLPFKYLCTKDGVDIYDSEVTELFTFVYLIRLSCVYWELNPKVEFIDEAPYDDEKVRMIPSKYPNLEYVRVAILGDIVTDEATQ